MPAVNFPDQINNTVNDDMVQIWLDSYDDMFSDFDPRPYTKRMWSDDFIFQIRKVVKEHSKKVIILNILLPIKEKKEDVEKILSKRLSMFFQQGKSKEIFDRKKAVQRGIYYILIGTAVMLLIEYILFINKENFFWHLLLQIFEPLSWFLLWMGLDTIVNSQKTFQEFKFFSKLANARVEFTVY